jgi:hypothetical protein
MRKKYNLYLSNYLNLFLIFVNSHVLSKKEYVFDVKAPTGQISLTLPEISSVMYRVPGLGLPESRYTGHSRCPVVPGHPVYSVVLWYVRTRTLSLCTVYLLQRKTDTETEHRTAERQTTDPLVRT